MKKLFFWLLFCALGATCTVLGVYIYKFGSILHPRLAIRVEEWGQFGDFVGGTLGTYFGFLAFVGVLFTVLFQSQQLELQRKQLEQAGRQANLEELQRMLSTLSSNLDQILYSALEDIPPSAASSRAATQSFTLFALLSSAGQVEINRDHSTIQPEVVTRAIRTIQLAMARLLIELDQLVMCLDRYRAGGGSADIQTLYYTRYRAVACWSDVLGFNMTPHTRAYFDPDKTRSLLRDETETSPS